MKHFITTAMAVGVMAVSLNAQAMVNFTVDPASGATVETLSEFTLNATTPYVDYAISYQSSQSSIKTYKDGNQFGSVAIFDETDSSYTIQLIPAFTEAGTYTVEIPANVLMGIDSNDEYGPLNDEPVTLAYNITGAEGPVVSVEFEPNSIYPEPGFEFDLTTEPIMDNVSLIYNKNVQLNGTPMATLAAEDGSYSEQVEITTFIYEPGLFFIQNANLQNQPKKSGKYVYTVPAKAFTDGTNYSAELTLEYEIKVAEGGDVDDVTVTGIEYTYDTEDVALVNDVELAAFADDAKIIFNTTNNLSVGYIFMSVVDNNPLNPDDAQRNFESRASRLLLEPLGSYWNDDEAPCINVVSDYVFKEGHTYDVTYQLYDFENPPYSRTLLTEGAFTIKGTTKGYEYSDIEVLNVTPEDGTIFNEADEGIITITFSGPVKINEAKSEFAVNLNRRNLEGTVTMSDDNTEATIVFPADMLENATAAVNVYLYITDMEGKSLFFGLDTGDESYLVLEYNCYLGTPDLTIEPATGEIEEFDHIIVSYVAANGENQSIAWANNFEAGPVTLTDLGSKEGRVFGYIREFETYETAMLPSDTGAPVEGVIAIIGYLENEAGEKIKITIPGTYVLNIPAASFNMGDGFSGFQCKQTYVTYTIVGEVPDETVYDFSPVSKDVTFNEENTEAVVDLKFNEDVYDNSDRTNEVALFDENGNKVAASIENIIDFNDFTKWSFSIKYDFEAGKEYTLVVPEGTFGTEEWASNGTYAQYCTGNANPEFTVTLKAEDAAVAEIGLDGTVETVYNLQGIKVGTTENLKALPAGLYIVKGEKFVVK